MRIGLVGIPRAPDLCLLKKRIEDMNHRAEFVNPRAFPQYALSSIGKSFTRLDHRDLTEFDCYYLGQLEARSRFFRGFFDREIWISLRERYLDFAQNEQENLAFQVVLLLCLGSHRPFVNQPRSFLKSRLRPAVLFRLSNAGLPTVPTHIEKNTTPEGVASSSRIRIEEETTFDVPCFPRTFEDCIGLRTYDAQETWTIVALRGYRGLKMIVSEGEHRRAADLKEDAAALAEDALEILDLELAEIQIGRRGTDLKIMDALPVPRISEFEDVTGAAVSVSIAERLLYLGGSK